MGAGGFSHLLPGVMRHGHASGGEDDGTYSTPYREADSTRCHGRGESRLPRDNVGPTSTEGELSDWPTCQGLRTKNGGAWRQGCVIIGCTVCCVLRTGSSQHVQSYPTPYTVLITLHSTEYIRNALPHCHAAAPLADVASWALFRPYTISTESSTTRVRAATGSTAANARFGENGGSSLAARISRRNGQRSASSPAPHVIGGATYCNIPFRQGHASLGAVALQCS